MEHAVAAYGFAASPFRRRAAAPGVASAGNSPQIADGLPIELRHLPAPPILQPADSVQFVDCAEAWQIAAEWRLSEEMLAAIEEQMASSEPATPLGRSLRFGRRAGALAVLHGNSIIDEASLRISLPPSGLSPAHLESMLKRLLRPHEDPRALASNAVQPKRRPSAQQHAAHTGLRRGAA